MAIWRSSSLPSARGIEHLTDELVELTNGGGVRQLAAENEHRLGGSRAVVSSRAGMTKSSPRPARPAGDSLPPRPVRTRRKRSAVERPLGRRRRLRARDRERVRLAVATDDDRQRV